MHCEWQLDVAHVIEPMRFLQLILNDNYDYGEFHKKPIILEASPDLRTYSYYITAIVGGVCIS